ncbi:hypothetical protein BESB_012920 [Besnoitia besnoiti]|uniref:Uncharacterized protein n=1 Tax=Besnoitia besnoiti TaxID=94643 RepID=A0A2A9MBB7_BESBE|nr:hypothetical protein BESB_012920 [Besnoitia besnoiti]PFH32680.1 hypothetical protein BESB_012920 [Besnoitia besnoiti]
MEKRQQRMHSRKRHRTAKREGFPFRADTNTQKTAPALPKERLVAVQRTFSRQARGEQGLASKDLPDASIKLPFPQVRTRRHRRVGRLKNL